MKESKMPALPDAPKTSTYELSTGAVALLHDILGTGGWYKDEAKPLLLMNRAYLALEALPDIERPKPKMAEAQDVFDKRVDAWAKPKVSFTWTDKQKAAVAVCVSFYAKQGGFSINEHTVSLLSLLGLGVEE